MEKVNERYNGSNSVIENVTLVTIQVMMAISVSLMFKNYFFQGMNIRESDMAPFFGIVVSASLLLLSKYQNLIKEFSQRTDTLERLVNERTLDLQKANQEMENYQKHLRSLASELSLTEERERRHLATDLHDHIGQALALSKIKLGLLQRIANSPDISKPLAEVRELIEQMIQDTRSLNFKLSLPVLYELGFEAAVDWLATDMHQQHGIQIQVEYNGQTSVLNNEVSVLLFQMVRELLFNIVKHAQATMAKIAIQKVGNQLQVEVADNGVGFDPAKNDFKKNDSKKCGVDGFGLFSIRERLNYFAGGLEIESEPGHGSRINMTIPI